MKISWYQGLEPEVERAIRGDFKSSLLIRNRLKKMLLDKIEAARSDARQKKNYDNANWANFIAESLGYERAMFEIISLIEDDEK